MNAIMTSSARTLIILGTSALLTGLSIRPAMANDEQRKVIVTSDASADAKDGDAPKKTRHVVIRSIEPDGNKQSSKESTWLGVSTEETSETLASQLGLKEGEGLVVSYVSKDSPAAKAGLKKNDVIVELDGQMLVDPVQFRKLVRMHADGDSVKLAYYRSGKRETVSAKLVKKTWEETSFGDWTLPENIKGLKDSLAGAFDEDHQAKMKREIVMSLDKAGIDGKKMSVDIERTMEQTRKAIADAVSRAHSEKAGAMVSDDQDKELAEMAQGGMGLGNNATVIIKNVGKSSRSISKSDETGSYFISATPEKHFTAHDKEGKVLFDGAIDTQEQQEKVPADLLKKAKIMLDQIDKGTVEIEQDGDSESDAPKAKKP